MVSVPASVYSSGPTHTSKGSRDSVRPLFSPNPLTATTNSFKQPEHPASSPQRTDSSSVFGRLTRAAETALYGGSDMQSLLSLIMGGEGEQLTQTILSALLLNGPNTSDQVKFLMLSGRLGKTFVLFKTLVAE